MAAKGSAAGFTEKRPDHLQSEGRRGPSKGQQRVLQQRDQITYILRAGDGHQRSPAGFALKRLDGLHSEGEMATKGHQQVFQPGDQITYFLRAGDGHQRVSSMFCTKQTG